MPADRLQAQTRRLYSAAFRGPPLDSRDPHRAAPPVAIIMGSRSDWPTLSEAAGALEALGVDYDARVVSAHRTPERLYAFAAKHCLRG